MAYKQKQRKKMMFGLLPPLPKKRKGETKKAYKERAGKYLDKYFE